MELISMLIFIMKYWSPPPLPKNIYFIWFRSDPLPPPVVNLFTASLVTRLEMVCCMVVHWLIHYKLNKNHSYINAGIRQPHRKVISALVSLRCLWVLGWCLPITVEEQQPPRCGGAGEDFNKIYPRLHTPPERSTTERERDLQTDFRVGDKVGPRQGQPPQPCVCVDSSQGCGAVTYRVSSVTITHS